jgi:hypothetical protein
MTPCAVFVAKHGQVDPGPHRLGTNCTNAMNDEQHTVDVDLNRGERKNFAEFYRLHRRTVIETMLDGERCSVSSGGVPAINRDPGRGTTFRFHLTVQNTGIAAPAEQPCSILVNAKPDGEMISSRSVLLPDSEAIASS